MSEHKLPYAPQPPSLYAPHPVGYWVLYAEVPQQILFSMHHKPTDEQIANTKRLLGWTWRDAK